MNLRSSRKPSLFIDLLCGLMILSAFMTSVFGQTAAKISGVVRDAAAGEPLIGANVVIVGTIMGASTNLEGEFFILNVPPGKYDVQASFLGYQRVLQQGVIANSGRTTTLFFTLHEVSIEMSVVIIAATRPDVELEKTSTSEIIRTDDIRHIAGIRDVGDALGLAADITDGHFRGGRSGEELYTLQGMGITNPLDNSSAFLPIMSAVEEVEVITSGFGAQYGNAQSGVVNISMKEGKSDRWRTRVESRMRSPGRKHFGPSVYDPASNPYLAFLLNTSVWKGDNDANRYYTQMADQFSSYFGLDTTLRAQVAYSLWRYQTKRDLGLTYGEEFDNSFEAATGGPIDDDKRMFLAMRSNTIWPVFPTERPNVEEQIMGNIVTDIGSETSLRLSGAYSREFSNIFPSANNLGYYNWMWDRLLAMQQRKTTNTQVGLRFTHALSQSTFYEVKLNTLLTHTVQGSSVAPDYLPDDLLGLPESNFNQMIAGVRTGPDRFTYGNGPDAFRDENTRTISLEAAFTSQITNSHLLNAGIQVSAFGLDIRNRANTRSNDGMTLTMYEANPYELGAYVQDKMEFEGMIANVGLRLDLWSQNTDYYEDLFSPYRYFTSDTTWGRDKDLAPRDRTPVIGRPQPRVGVSFPVTTSTVFHLNYGSFLQRPSFQYIAASSYSQGSGLPNTFGNPRLQPQTTNSYDVGITQGLGEGFTLDVSGYYKDVKNLIQRASYTDRGGETYNTYVNRDYADIRGFRLSLNKRRGIFIGTVNYQFSVATGKSSTPFNASPSYREEPNTGAIITDLQNVPIKDILLDFDRTHNLIVNLGFITPEDWGPSVRHVYDWSFGLLVGLFTDWTPTALTYTPLGDIALSTNSFVRSGRPYTYSIGVKLINNKRSPWETGTNVKVSKRISGVVGTSLSVYCEIFNVFNDRILNYSYIFDQSNTNSEFNITRYELSPINDPNGLRFLNASNAAPFLVDQSFLIYDNAPRSYNVGITVDF